MILFYLLPQLDVRQTNTQKRAGKPCYIGLIIVIVTKWMELLMKMASIAHSVCVKITLIKDR